MCFDGHSRINVLADAVPQSDPLIPPVSGAIFYIVMKIGSNVHGHEQPFCDHPFPGCINA